MVTVPVSNDLIEIIKLFGDIELVIKEALRAYTIEQCQLHLTKAVKAVGSYKQKYSCDYETFKLAIQTDENFLSSVESQNPLWEEDAMEWEYWLEEQQSLINRLCDILRR